MNDQSVSVKVFGRIVQGIRYLQPRRAATLDDELQRLLDPAEVALVRRLTVADRAHLLAVHEGLRRYGCTDQDLLKAALLHDVGKVDGDVRVGLSQRSLAVIARAVSPRLLDQLASRDGARWRQALALVAIHPELGAALARAAGCNERVCWLIHHHHDAAAGDNAGLRLLQSADEGRRQ